jgi:two-component system, OmpR family, response regulator
VGALVNGLATRTVLIVEDEWLVRMELATGFEDENCVVLESASAEDAIAILGSDDGGARVDLLVTDIRLAGPLTGWDLAAQARELDPGIAVIYVSANPPAPGRDVSGSLFLDKPALTDRVIAAARQLLS